MNLRADFSTLIEDFLTIYWCQLDKCKSRSTSQLLVAYKEGMLSVLGYVGGHVIGHVNDYVISWDW